MSDEPIAEVTGTASFDEVSVESTPQGFKVSGVYLGSVTVYETPSLKIEGLSVSGEIESLTLSHSEYIEVIAEKEKIRIQSPD